MTVSLDFHLIKFWQSGEGNGCHVYDGVVRRHSCQKTISSMERAFEALGDRVHGFAAVRSLSNVQTESFSRAHNAMVSTALHSSQMGRRECFIRWARAVAHVGCQGIA